MSIEDRWIPTTTCMWPKVDGEYLITVYNKYTEEMGVPYVVEAVIFTTNHGRKKWEQEISNEFGESETIYYDPKDVTAWMPYPKPYKNNH